MIFSFYIVLVIYIGLTALSIELEFYINVGNCNKIIIQS